MKTSTTLMLLALNAASLSVAATLPASAQTYKPRDQTCDNNSTARDKVQRPDSRCVNVTSETYTNEAAERAGKAAQAFTGANPPKNTDIIKGGQYGGSIVDGVDHNGVPTELSMASEGRVLRIRKRVKAPARDRNPPSSGGSRAEPGTITDRLGGRQKFGELIVSGTSVTTESPAMSRAFFLVHGCEQPA